MTHEFRRREIDRGGVRLSYLDNDAAGPVIVLRSGSHDAHLDATEEWAEVLRSAANQACISV